MGSSNSSTARTLIDNSRSVKEKIEASIKSGAKTEVVADNSNIININIANISKCCSGLKGEEFTQCSNITAKTKVIGNIDTNQTISGKVLVTAVVTNDSRNRLINDAMDEISNKVDDFVKQKNDSGVLSDIFGESNSDAVSTTINNSVRADIENSLSVEVLNNMRLVSGQENKSNINICAGEIDAKNISASQDISLDIYVQNILGNIIDTMTNNEEIRKISSNEKRVVSQTNTNWLSDFINGLTALEKAIVIGIIVIVVISVIMGVVILLRPHNKHNYSYPTQNFSAAPAYY